MQSQHHKAAYSCIVVDDDEIDRLTTLAFIEQYEFLHVIGKFITAEQALAGLGSIKPDILFLDINLPYKNGLTCLKEIRADRKLKELRVAMHSTAQGPYVEQSYELGANLYIPKPLSLLVYPIIIQKVFMLDWSQYIPQPPFKKFLLTETII